MKLLRKLAALKRTFWEKSLWWTSFIIKLQPFSTQPSILSENEAHVRPSCRSAENSNIFTGKPCFLSLTLSWRRPLSYKNQSIDLLCKSMDWFPYDNGARHESVKQNFIAPFTTQSPRVSGTHLINLGRMKDWLDFRAILWFWTWDPGLEI